MELRLTWDVALAAMLLAFILSMVVAWTYTITYQGLSYSRVFVQTLAMGGVISTLVMLSIGDDIARGLGLVGALTIIRFRSTLKDTRDLMYIFASLAVGVACGVQVFSIAVVGTVVFALSSIFVAWSGFGSRRSFDAVLRVQLPSNPFQQESLKTILRRNCRNFVLIILRRNCRNFVLINLRDTGTESQEHAYHIKLNDPSAKGQFIAELNTVPGLGGVTLLMQDTAVEV